MFSMVGLAIVLGGTNLASAQYDRWNPYLEVEGRAGDGAERAQGRIFAPIFQDDCSMLFGDIRLMYTDQQAYEGNFGLGYRQMISNRRLWGAYGFFDIKESALDNTFYQGSAGVELLDINWGLRANAYLPDMGAKFAPGGNAFVQGGQIFVQGNRERAYYGMDVEAEHILWRSKKPTANLHAGDVEFWAAGGYFYFDNDTSNFQEVAGPRARVEARLYDLPLLGNDSRIVASAQYEYDDVRGSVSQGFLNVRIPLAPGGCKGCRPKMNLLDRRMVTPIVRDIDIVTNVAQDGRIEGAKNAFLGTVLDDVVTLTAADEIQALIEGGADEQVFILDGVDGAEMLFSGIDLNDGQILIGGGGSMNVIGCDTGLEAVFTAQGEAFAFDQTDGGSNVLNITNNNGIFGLTTFGGNNSIAGINAGNFEISDNTLMGAGANAIGFLPVGDTILGSITNNRLVGTGGDGIGVLSIGASDIDLMIAGNSFDMIGGNGIGITASLGSATITTTIDDNTFNGVEDDAVSIGITEIDATASPVINAAITNNRIFGNGLTENGIDIFTGNDTDLTLVVDNNLFDGVNNDAIQLDSDATFFGFFGSNATHNVTITNNMILGNGNTSDGIDIFLDDDSTLMGTISGNIFDDVTSDGIEIETDGDSVISMLTISENEFLGRNSTSDGLDVFVDADSSMTLIVDNNIFNSVTDDAFEADVNDDGFLDLMFTNNEILGNGTTSDGFELDANDDTDVIAVIQGNTFMNVDGDNIDIDGDDDAALDIDILDNTITGGEFGINFFTDSGDDDNLLTVGGNTINVTSASAGIFINANGDLELDSNMQDNTVTNDGAGMIFNIDDDGDVQGNIMINGVDEMFGP
ncbi:inverse autotransporter beta domain-containing protein [bacterium]|nr:inverse autotransporter beta domain-containing protein [bacterium]